MASTTIESDQEWEQVTTSGTPSEQFSLSPAPPTAPKATATTSDSVDALPPISASPPPPPAPPAEAKATATKVEPTSSKPSTSLRVLSSLDVTSVLATLSLSDLLDSQSRAFRAFSDASTSPISSTLQAPPRIALNLPNHTSLFMPARAAEVGGSAIKIVSVPGGAGDTDGIPGTTLVFNDQTGRVEGVVNAAELTGVRTAAGSAVASKMLLAGKRGEEMRKGVVFGTGVQAFWHTHLHLQLFPSLTHIAILARPASSPTPRLSALLAKLTAAHPNVHFEHSSVDNYDRGQAVHNADLILCCTPSTEPLFPPTQPRRGTHLVLVGSYKPHMLEVDPSLLKDRAGVVFVDSKEMTKIEAGELQGFEGEVCEVGSVLGEEGKGQEMWEKGVGGGGDLTVFKSVGLAVQDVAITRLVFDKAKEMGLGVVVPNY